MNWAREIAQRLINERPNEEIYTVASGVSPSGFVHIGNFREIATPYLVVKELIKLGKKERAYRGGYLDARKDNAKVYKSKRSKKTKF